MTDDDKPVSKRKRSAKEHLAGVAGTAKEIQTLASEHLLRTQDPIRDQPIGVTPEEQQ